jgi:hypothetical protein
MIENQPPFLWFKKSIQKPQVRDSQDYVQKPQRNCTFMNSASALVPSDFSYLNEDISTTPLLFLYGNMDEGARRISIGKVNIEPVGSAMSYVVTLCYTCKKTP